jgi:hypothetical protein
VEYNVPSTNEVQALLRMRLDSYLKSSRAISEFAAEAVGLSHAEIARAVNDSVYRLLKFSSRHC